ncbi:MULTISPECIES: glycosyltransferase family 1 protein [unclassified Methylocystis]|uniref:glycosyltransferase family 4 protein n=1 Tax=unclassified Methylocystis TaxID=2625913 RepID=UPI001AEEDBF5|nr:MULTISPECIES: glycosyltransferase family 1 protein [unclassified Methylocystis]
MSFGRDEVPQLTARATDAARSPVIYDVTRIVTRALNAAPNGIDRVDFALARHFLARDQGQRGALICTAVGPRLADPDSALETIEGVESLWREDSDAGQDDVYRAVVAALLSNGSAQAAMTRVKRAPTLSFLERNWHAMRRWAPYLGRPTREAPHGAIYFNVTQFLVDRSWYVRWLTARPDIKPVFFVHDLLPIEAPEFFRAREAMLHPRRMSNVCRYGAGAVVGSQAVAGRLRQFAAECGRPELPICVARLPVSPVFSSRAEPPAALDGVNYFVVCGTIEPRKNLSTLLNVWRVLARDPAPPKLIIVGKRGWLSAAAIEMLERSAALRPHVIEAGGLSTPGLRSLLAGARALLMPSFAEGFGLPVAEALAAGTPVVASDIEAFREVGGDAIDYVDPLDGLGWLQAVRDYSTPHSPRRRAALARLSRGEAVDPSAFFAKIDDFIAQL